jgi:hypothetical protein
MCRGGRAHRRAVALEQRGTEAVFDTPDGVQNAGSLDAAVAFRRTGGTELHHQNESPQLTGVDVPDGQRSVKYFRRANRQGHGLANMAGAFGSQPVRAF